MKNFYLTDSMNKEEKIEATKEFLKDYIDEVENSDLNYVKFNCAETVEMYKLLLEVLNRYEN